MQLRDILNWVLLVIVCRLAPPSPPEQKCTRSFHPLRKYDILNLLAGTREELDKIEYKIQSERIIESILESIPQTALQLFITGHEPYMSGLQGVSIVSSLFNLSCTLVSLDMERIKQLKSSKRNELKKQWQVGACYNIFL